jgi:hypothetical protein
MAISQIITTGTSMRGSVTNPAPATTSAENPKPE